MNRIRNELWIRTPDSEILRKVKEMQRKTNEHLLRCMEKQIPYANKACLMQDTYAFRVVRSVMR